VNFLVRITRGNDRNQTPLFRLLFQVPWYTDRQ
jgi:hypothetical protein